MHDDTERYTIGQLARRTGLSARTIRFWSDAGIIPPTARSPGGYRVIPDRVREAGRLGSGRGRLV
ncbi:MerR family transcriptional regulator [Nocardia sp. N2S4-5]|uniref:MerR family transcriptional regulator n=1 Tax=Nocardia sp. N2S4-5 TaxID=3351565 RepID=UPI0037D9426C